MLAGASGVMSCGVCAAEAVVTDIDSGFIADVLLRFIDDHALHGAALRVDLVIQPPDIPLQRQPT